MDLRASILQATFTFRLPQKSLWVKFISRVPQSER